MATAAKPQGRGETRACASCWGHCGNSPIQSAYGLSILPMIWFTSGSRVVADNVPALGLGLVLPTARDIRSNRVGLWRHHQAQQNLFGGKQ